MTRVYILSGTGDWNVFPSKERMLTYLRCWSPDQKIEIKDDAVLYDGVKRFDIKEGILWP